MTKSGGKGRTRKICEPKEPEDWCFDCKDGGELVICDHKNCGKVYHASCVGKEDSFFESVNSWICGWHSCFSCHKSPKFYCLGCPNAVCKRCYAASEFIIVRGEQGLCSDCLELVLIIEQNLEQDSLGNKISLNDGETYESLFKEYWDVIKVKEGLTSDDVCAAQTKYKKGKNYVHQRSYSESEEEEEEEEDLISYNSDIYDTCKHNPRTKRKRSNSQDFLGWGSKPLICFLTSIGKDQIEPLTRWDVNSLIHEYIIEKNLHHPKQKKKFIPDKKLIPIFRKKVVSKNQIYSLLGAHFAENLQHTVEKKIDDENKSSSTFKHLSDQICKESRLSSLVGKSLLKKGDFIIQPSCFASINDENIKPIYLKRSLVQKLSKNPESFEDKVIGTFVKVRAGPNDHKQRNNCHLVRVIGVNKTIIFGEIFSEFLLQVSFMPKAIPISELSDDDFTEQECENLRQKVKDGLLQKLTVVELQEKARSLHEDITKHWVEMRLVYLQQRIEFANDKGRHREKTALIDEKVELAQPWKLEQLLQRMPSVSPELIEAKYDPEDDLEPDKQGLGCLGSLQSGLQLVSKSPALSTKKL